MHLGYPEQQRHVAGDDYDVEEYRADDSAVDIELGITNKDEIAKNLIKLGLNIDDIVKATGLSKEEIEKISKEK